MSNRTPIAADPRRALFEALGEVRAGMLGIEGANRHMQPMTHFPDAEAGALWFVTASATELVRSIGGGARARYCFTGREHDFHASLTGAIEQRQDRTKLEEIWSPAVAAWFKGGMEDPEVCLLRFLPQEAALWEAERSALHVGVEVLRANLVPDRKPDLGDHAILRFDLS